MKSKKGILILSLIAALCAVGFIASRLLSWQVDQSKTEGNLLTAEKALGALASFGPVCQMTVFNNCYVAQQIKVETPMILYITEGELSDLTVIRLASTQNVMSSFDRVVHQTTGVTALQQTQGNLSNTIGHKPDLTNIPW